MIFNFYLFVDFVYVPNSKKEVGVDSAYGNNTFEVPLIFSNSVKPKYRFEQKCLSIEIVWHANAVALFFVYIRYDFIEWC